ncbi:MAG: CsgG/HfaB family protein [Spirochaetaceae bacterium]|nr:CsgG/HfaB family protein [Spirochaetaceae bacterium]
MKKGVFLAIFALISLVGLYAQARLAFLNDPSIAPKSGQSEIFINAENAERDIVVWVNGAVAAHLFPKSREKIIVPNGRVVLEAADTTSKNGQWNIGSKKQLLLEVNSSSVTVGMTTRYGALLSLVIQNNTPVGTGGKVATTPTTPQPPSRNTSAKSLDEAVTRAAAVLAARIPNGTILAVISIASADSEIAEFVIEELAYLLLETRKFKLVDRKSLDAIKAETRFQSSGDVDDKSAVSIGKMLGATIVITGSISGSGSTRRLRAKALDVKTAEIIEMASEPF